jgi:hypothetical protein
MGARVVFDARAGLAAREGREAGGQMGIVRVRSEVRGHVPYARSAVPVDVAVREHSLGRGQGRRWVGYGSASLGG